VTRKRYVTLRPITILSALAFGFVCNLIFTPVIVAQTSNQNPPGILIATAEKGVRYLTGGIGSSEREVMEDWGANYDLKLIFAESSGHFLSDVKVVIQDRAAREILSVLTNGPWLYVELSPGTYRVRANFEGVTREIPKLHIAEHGRVERFIHWDLDEE
jgi:exopolysaccharide biosynthesis predicted pyruvyltransferase EpsI